MTLWKAAVKLLLYKISALSSIYAHNIIKILIDGGGMSARKKTWLEVLKI